MSLLFFRLFSQPWVVHLGWTLLHFLWQGTLIAIVFAITRALLARSMSTHGRYLLACATLGAMTISPVLTYGALAHVGADMTPGAVWRIPAIVPMIVPRDAWQRALPWLVLAWFGGVTAFSARLIGGWRLASRMRSTAARPAPAEWQRTLEGLIARMGASRPVRLLISSLVEVPTVIGWLKPVILMPVGALTGLPPEHVTALLAHELAHIRRHDYLVNILQSIAEAVLFYHPAVWWVSDQIRAERELCCDDLAVAACGGDALTYACALAEVESFRPAHAGTVLAANGGSLAARIRRLIGQGPSVSQSLPGPGAVLMLALLWLAGVGAVTMHGSEGSTALPPLSVTLPSPAVPTIALQPPVLPLTPVLSALLFDPFFEPPQAIAPAPAQASSSISGRVTNSATGAGIGEVAVRLSIVGQPGAASPQQAVTDDTGAFRIAGIPDGQYTITAHKNGYFGPDIAGPSPKVRVFGDTRFDLKMTPPASLRGRVLGPEGKPAAGIAVQAGVRPEASVTDENGEFVFKEVPPHIPFTLSATPKPQTDAKNEERIVTTYYPSAVDSSQAERVSVQGVDLFGYDIRLQTAPAHSIRGVVIDLDGKPAAHARVSVSKRASGMVTMVMVGRGNIASLPGGIRAAEPVETGEDGTFAFPPVPEGDWNVGATLRPDDSPAENGVAEVRLSKNDIEDLEVRLEQPVKIEGTADWGDTPPATIPQSLARYWSLEGPAVGGGGPGLAGRYFIEPGPPTPGYYAAAAMLGDRDVLGQVAELSGPTSLKIIYKTGGGSVRGTVEHGANALAVLIANETPESIFGFGALCDADGAFAIPDVPPGEYTAVVVHDASELVAPEFSGVLAANGKRVKVEARAASQVELEVARQP